MGDRRLPSGGERKFQVQKVIEDRGAITTSTEGRICISAEPAL
ncbi:unnamed protein product [Rhodiola kirilowii]